MDLLSRVVVSPILWIYYTRVVVYGNDPIGRADFSDGWFNQQLGCLRTSSHWTCKTLGATTQRGRVFAMNEDIIGRKKGKVGGRNVCFLGVF